jgi:methyl-accepting chemotaxis protein
MSKDEPGDMAKYFNRMIDKIKALIFVIKDESTTLSQTGDELAAHTTETAAAVTEITANIQSIKSRVLNQSASVTQTAVTMNRIVDHINMLGKLVENQTASVSKSSASVEKMVANIQSVTQTLVRNVNNIVGLSESSEIGRKGLEEVAADIQKIAEESAGLLEINAVMENISSQTNLLSMNAAIEAAHAGEAGKGFAVVANEIRKLAESSSSQSKTISVVLKKIKDSIDKITRSTEGVLSKFEVIGSGIQTVTEQEKAVKDAMEEQEVGSKIILEAISQLKEMTEQVKQNANEMMQGSREVIGESRSLEQLTEEITGGVNEIATGAEQINSSMDRVAGISIDNRERISALVAEVSKFKV